MRRLFLVFLFLASPLWAGSVDTSLGPVKIERIVDGLKQPWGLAFLPDGGFLVTERGGTLWYYNAQRVRSRVTGTPDVVVKGQGGLLDVMIPRDFATSRQVFLSYALKQEHGEGTALGVGRLSSDNMGLDGFNPIFQMTPGSRGKVHFGGRIVEARDGTLFLTIGERGDQPLAQDLTRHNGTIVRINRDGSIPHDNPFANQAGAQPDIWSYGHRNPQGATLDLNGALWVVEHGARGGDEVNRIKPGANYGWPIIAYGKHYSGARIGEGTHKDGMMQPAHYWDPSIAPSGMMIYSGALWPEWRGDIFVGSLKFDYVSRLDPDAGYAEEVLRSRETGRVRDIREAPDGTIWFLSVDKGAVYRMSPG